MSTAQSCRVKEATENTEANQWGFVPAQLYLPSRWRAGIGPWATTNLSFLKPSFYV